MGRVCVRDLVASGVDDVVVADLDPARAQDAVDEAPGPGRASAVAADATDHDTLVRLLSGADVVANCTNYLLNPSVMWAAAAAETHYLDLGGLFHGTRAQLELAGEMEEAGILCLLGMGSTPGTMNVMAAHGSGLLDEVSEIHLRCGGSDPAPSPSPLPAPYAIDTILDEFTIPGFALRDGELVEVPPASEEEAFEFPEPVGVQTAIATLHSELATIPAHFSARGLREMTFKVAFGDEFIARYRQVAKLGLGATEPLRLPSGTEIVPRELLKHLAGPQQEFSGRDTESLVVILRGQRAGSPMEIRVEEVSPPNEAYRVGGADANTGVPPSIAAQMIARGEIKGLGAKAPEAVVEPGPYLAALHEREISVTVTERELDT